MHYEILWVVINRDMRTVNKKRNETNEYKHVEITSRNTHIGLVLVKYDRAHLLEIFTRKRLKKNEHCQSLVETPLASSCIRSNANKRIIGCLYMEI